MLTLDAALAAVADLAQPVAGTETVPLATLDGRVLARDLVAPIALPPFANAAMDGYAVRFADLAAAGETRLPLLARLPAGTAPGAAALAGGAVRIFTGAALPPGADTVVMQEQARPEADAVRLPPGLVRGAHIRRAGEDVAAGATVLRAGRRLRPPDIALAAALGLPALSVRRRVRVAVFSTGDELVAPGEPLRSAAIYDANRALLLTLAARAGAEVLDLGILPDRAEVLSAQLRMAAAQADLILTSGGVSAGEEDHVRAAVEAMGTLAFWKVAIKPGKPVAFGRAGGCVFMGLPGNPSAACVTFALLARPLILGLAGAEPEPPGLRSVRLGFEHVKRAGIREFVPVAIATDATGAALIRRCGGAGAMLSAFSASDGLAVFAEAGTRFSIGDTVPFIPHGAAFA